MGDLDNTIIDHQPIHKKPYMTDEEGEAFTRALMSSPVPELRSYAEYVSHRIPSVRALPPNAKTPADPPPLVSDIASRTPRGQLSSSRDDHDTARDLDAPLHKRR